MLRGVRSIWLLRGVRGVRSVWLLLRSVRGIRSVWLLRGVRSVRLLLRSVGVRSVWLIRGVRGVRRGRQWRRSPVCDCWRGWRSRPSGRLRRRPSPRRHGDGRARRPRLRPQCRASRLGHCARRSGRRRRQLVQLCRRPRGRDGLPKGLARAVLRLRHRLHLRPLRSSAQPPAALSHIVLIEMPPEAHFRRSRRIRHEPDRPGWPGWPCQLRV